MKIFERSHLNKKGQAMAQIGQLGVAIAALAIALTITFLIMAQGRVQIGEVTGTNVSNHTGCMDSVACNATATLQAAVDDIPGWVPLIIITIIGAILLGLVSMFRRR